MDKPEYKTFLPHDKIRAGTRKNRNEHLLDALVNDVSQLWLENIDVIHVWPWWTLPLFVRPKWKESNWWRFENIRNRIMINVLREMSNNALFWFETFETKEIVDMFASKKMAIDWIDVVDIEPKVINAVKRLVRMEKLNKNIDFRYHLIDLLESNSEPLWDVVVCHNVIQRIEHPEVAIKNVASFLKLWWILSMHMRWNSVDDHLKVLWKWFEKFNWNIIKTL